MATPLVLHPRFLNKTIFSRILTPRARYPQYPSTIPIWSRPWTLPGSSMARRCWGHPAQVSCAHVHPRARKRFPGYRPPWGKGATISTPFTVPYLNFDPAGPVPRGPFYNPHSVLSLELFLLLPWPTTAGSTWHRSPVPNLPLGARYNKFAPGNGPPSGKGGNNTHNSQ